MAHRARGGSAEDSWHLMCLRGKATFPGMGEEGKGAPGVWLLVTSWEFSDHQINLYSKIKL